MADNDFPKLLYKKAEGGNGEPVWNLGNFEVKEVADQDAADAALADGWTLRPDDEPAAPKAGKGATKPATAGEASQA